MVSKLAFLGLYSFPSRIQTNCFIVTKINLIESNDTKLLSRSFLRILNSRVAKLERQLCRLIKGVKIKITEYHI